MSRTRPPTTCGISSTRFWVRGKAHCAGARPVRIAAIPGHMATMSYKQGKRILWDEKTEKYSFV